MKKEKLLEVCEYEPSDFAAIGQPCCSVWGKHEIEIIALAYVQALANLGNTWQRISREQAQEALNDQQRRETRGFLRIDCDRYKEWFEMIADRINSSDGALSVRGFWNEHWLNKARKPIAESSP